MHEFPSPSRPPPLSVALSFCPGLPSLVSTYHVWVLDFGWVRVGRKSLVDVLVIRRQEGPLLDNWEPARGDSSRCRPQRGRLGCDPAGEHLEVDQSVSRSVCRSIANGTVNQRVGGRGRNLHWLSLRPNCCTRRGAVGGLSRAIDCRCYSSCSSMGRGQGAVRVWALMMPPDCLEEVMLRFDAGCCLCLRHKGGPCTCPPARANVPRYLRAGELPRATSWPAPLHLTEKGHLPTLPT